jgi:hypothetical protein
VTRTTFESARASWDASGSRLKDESDCHIRSLFPGG